MAEGKKHSEKRSRAGRMAHEKRMAMPMTRLQGMREERGWSKAKAADAAGMDPTTYSRIERMAVNPFPAQAEAIAKAFGTSVYDLTEANILRSRDEQAPVKPDDASFDLPEGMDPMVELGQRVKALEDDLAATMASLGALKANHKMLVHHVEQMEQWKAELAESELSEAGNVPVWVTVNVFGNDGGES